MIPFCEVEIGDTVIVYDECSYGRIEHLLVVLSIEYDEGYVTATNPRGMICYGGELWYGAYDDDSITVVTEQTYRGTMPF